MVAKEIPNGMLIRPATPDDVPLILQLVRELADYEHSPDQVVATEASLQQHLFGQGFGRGPVAEAIIGELDGRAEGFALFFANFSTWLASSGIYLEDLFVRPAARGRGLGKALLTRVAQIAVQRGCGRVEWSVLSWNKLAIGFYDGLGAKAMSEWTVYRLAGEALARMGGGGESVGEANSR